MAPTEWRLLLVVHHYPPDVNSTGMLMEALFERAAARGHEVTVLTTFPHYEGFTTWPQYRRKLFVTETGERAKVHRVWSYAGGNKSMIRRLFNYLTFNLMAIVRGLFLRGRFDIVFCTNGSFFSGITGFVLSRVKGGRFVYNVQDLYPEVPVEQGQLINKRAIAILAAVERFMYRRADHIAVIAGSFADNIAGKGIDGDRISVVPNFVDTDFIRPLDRDNDVARRLGLLDRFVVAHAGNVGYVYDLETVLDAAALLSEDPEVLFLVVGDGVARPGLERRARELGLDNVRFVGFQPRSDLPGLRAACDAGLSLYKPGSGRYSLPSKVYELMASGRPLIASADPDSDVLTLVREAGCGLIVPPGDPHALVQAVRRLAGDPGLREQLSRAGRATAEARFSADAVLERYLGVFAALTHS